MSTSSISTEANVTQPEVDDFLDYLNLLIIGNTLLPPSTEDPNSLLQDPQSLLKGDELVKELRDFVVADFFKKMEASLLDDHGRIQFISPSNLHDLNASWTAKRRSNQIIIHEGSKLRTLSSEDLTSLSAS